MRDVIFSIILLGLLPVSYRRPFIGLLVFSWLAYMRPQDLCWGFARQQRWSFLIAFVTMVGYAQLRPDLWFRRNTRCYLMMFLVLWVTLGVIAANTWSPGQVDRWVELAKIIGVALFTTAVVRTAAQLRVMVWVIALSLGFYGVKSGLTGVLTGMSAQVLVGPFESGAAAAIAQVAEQRKVPFVINIVVLTLAALLAYIASRQDALSPFHSEIAPLSADASDPQAEKNDPAP